MTVKEVVSLLKTAKHICLCHGGIATKFDPQNTLTMEAYGDFVVDRICSLEEEDYELNILMRPVKKVNV